MRRFHSQSIYNPTGGMKSHLVFFDHTHHAYQERHAVKVIKYLESLSHQMRARESLKFMKWVLTCDCQTLLEYATMLLDYFHTRQLLLYKHSVLRQSTQKPKYVVVYNLDVGGKHDYFTQEYSSIRAIREDSGVRRYRFNKQPTQNIVLIP